MSNIVTATVTIKGVRPIMFHKFGPDAIPLEKKEKTGVAGNDPEEWKKGYSATKDGQLYVDPSYVFGCIRDGARHVKKGRGSIQAMVAATLQVVDTRVLFDRFMPEDGLLTEDPDQPVYLDVRGVRNPNSKGMNIRYRVACSAGWRATFTMLWDKTIVSRGEMESALIDSGKLCGLADGRKIGFGRFEIEEFKIAEEATA